MTIMNRFFRLCRADIHGVMDQIEDKELLLKQVMRDMESLIEQKKAGLKKQTLSREQACQTHEHYMVELNQMEEDVTAAISKEKEDIARMLIKKRKRIENHAKAIKRHLDVLNKDIAERRETLNEQQMEYDKLKLKTAGFYCDKPPHDSSMDLGRISGQTFEMEPTDEEIELELFRRKDALKGGDER